MSRFSDKEKQLFWNLKFHAVLSTIFSQLTLTLNCYSVMVSSWRHVISPVPEWKKHPNPAMIQHIRALQKSSTPWSVKCGMDPGITSTYAKRQDCSTLSIPALFADLVLVFGVVIR